MRLSIASDEPLGIVVDTPLGEGLPRNVVDVAIQTALRGAISGFLHGHSVGHWYRHAWTGDGPPLAYHDVLSRLLPRFAGVAPDEMSTLCREPRPFELPDWLATLYRLSSRLVAPAAAPRQLAPTPQPVLRCSLPRSVRRLASEMGAHNGLQLILHGSLATCDATAYSDVDILLFIADDWLMTGERCSALRGIVSHAQRWLYRYDPLQHHGFMIVSQFDLDRYARIYFPLELLSHAYSLGEPREVAYRLRPADNESVARLRRVSTRLEQLEQGDRPAPRTRYALKLALSELMLLPSLCLEAKGQVLYKRDSFGAVRPMLSPTANMAMEALSAWRLDWKRGTWESVYRVLGPWLPAKLSVRLLARARSANVNRRDRERWSALVTGARALGFELARFASLN